ncbi:hypothetical protein C8F01DRAFT_1090580 [Mycena amicta]|nr:hypothetical protein C8F01DRAFT_1090580 [Mycena amicta]
MKPNSTPCLPPEIERLIFRTAALVSPSDARTFLLVAFRVKEWVEPLLYRSLFVASSHFPLLLLGPSDTIVKLTRETFDTLVDRKSLSFLADSVQNLLLVGLSMEDVSLILSICSGVKDLLVLPGAVQCGALDSLTELQRLKCKVSQFFDLEISSALRLATRPTLAHLTHLEMLYEDAHNAAELTHLWTEILALPALTHLACSSDHWKVLLPEATGAVLTALHPSGALRAFVMISYVPSTESNANIDGRLKSNPGFVLFPNGIGLSAVDWGNGVTSGDDFWARADELISKRRAGEIDRESTLYRMTPRLVADIDCQATYTSYQSETQYAALPFFDTS